MTDEKRPGLPPAPVDEPATAEEEAAAAALRGALEEGEEAGPARAEAEAAGLLRFSRDAGELEPRRQEAVLRRVLAARPRARRWWRWAVPATACAAAAAAVVILALRGPGAGLPSPPRALLEAQLAAARGGPAATTALESEMQAYRERVYATLARRYERDPRP